MPETRAPGVSQRTVRWFDHHCHLTTAGSDPAALVAAARAAGVERLVTVGCDVEDSRRAAAIAAGFDSVWATAGVHPHDADGGTDGLVELLDADHEARRPQFVAVGECGLDYYYDNSDRRAQREVFARQIELAHRFGLPLVIHARDAWADTFAILDDNGIPAHTVFHCFTGGVAEAERCLARGAWLSVSGIVTFNNAEELRAAVAITPLDRLLVETDTPYLAPVPHRGRPNEPANVVHVGEKVAEIRDLSISDVASLTWDNTCDFYGM